MELFSSCISREQLDVALSILTRGIICCDALDDADELAELFRLRLHVLELNPDLLDRMQRLHTLQQVMTRSSWSTVSYDILRSIYGIDQPEEKLDMMLRQLLEQVDSGNIGYPDDIIEKGVDETRRRE